MKGLFWTGIFESWLLTLILSCIAIAFFSFFLSLFKLKILYIHQYCIFHFSSISLFGFLLFLSLSSVSIFIFFSFCILPPQCSFLFLYILPLPDFLYPHYIYFCILTILLFYSVFYLEHVFSVMLHYFSFFLAYLYCVHFLFYLLSFLVCILYCIPFLIVLSSHFHSAISVYSNFNYCTITSIVFLFAYLIFFHCKISVKFTVSLSFTPLLCLLNSFAFCPYFFAFLLPLFSCN